MSRNDGDSLAAQRLRQVSDPRAMAFLNHLMNSGQPRLYKMPLPREIIWRVVRLADNQEARIRYLSAILRDVRFALGDYQSPFTSKENPDFLHELADVVAEIITIIETALEDWHPNSKDELVFLKDLRFEAPKQIPDSFPPRPWDDLNQVEIRLSDDLSAVKSWLDSVKRQ